MASFRLSRFAEADIAQILAISEKRWGTEGRRRYAAILAAGMRKAAHDPQGRTTRERNDLLPGIRSLHLGHARGDDPRKKVRQQVHVIYYSMLTSDSIEIVRVLHERMDPNQHVRAASRFAR
jgi:toxin ParE1/3/4